MKMKMGDRIKATWDLIRFNWLTVLLFVGIFSFFNFFSVTSIGKICMKLVFLFNGTTYLAPSNVGKIWINPLSWITFIVMFLGFCMIASFEIAGLVYVFSASRQKIRANVVDAIIQATSRCMNTLYPRNWNTIIYILFLMPFGGLFPLFQSVMYVSLPEFIRDYIESNTLLAIGVSAGLLFLVLYFLRTVFALVTYNSRENRFSDALNDSKEVSKGKRFRLFLCIVVTLVLGYIVVYGIGGAASGLISWFRVALKADAGTISASLALTSVMRYLSSLLPILLLPIFDIAMLVVIYEEYSGNVIPYKDTSAGRKGTWLAVFLVIVGIAVTVTYFIYKGSGSYMLAEPDRPAIVAHRGDSVRAPENTMPAFVLAMAEKPEYLEFDVHQTKDGVVIVSHDDNLKRVSGKNICVHELTYEEASKLDVGSWFSEEYKGTHLSTLDETLKYLREFPEVTVQIEIKPTGYDHDLEQAVIDVINANDMHDRCMITSLNLPALQNVKKIDPTMITVYSMAIAYGKITDIPNIDYFTIEQNYITPELVARVHAAGGKCYAWTANTEETVQGLVDSDIDGILTDNPIMMYDALERADYTGGIRKILRYFLFSISRGF